MQKNNIQIGIFSEYFKCLPGGERCLKQKIFGQWHAIGIEYLAGRVKIGTVHE